jgi:hypothetical protein
MPRFLALAVLLVLVLSRASAFASPPDPTWIPGIYDGADGDEAVIRSTNRVGSVGVTVAAPMPGRRSEPLVVWESPDYRHPRPVAEARGPPTRGRLVAVRSADSAPAETACHDVAAPAPLQWSARWTVPARWGRCFAWLRGPP